ncbi:hypothetical protein FHI69_25915, partial [Janthinobacterium lividum]
ARHYNTLLERTVGQRTAELQRFRGAMDATTDAIFLVDVVGPRLFATGRQIPCRSWPSAGSPCH